MSQTRPRPTVRRFGWINGVGLWALYRREVVRSARDWIDSALGPMVVNLLLLAVFALAAEGVGWRFRDLDVVSFVAPALVIFAIAQRALSGPAASILFDKHTGALTDIWMAPLSPLERVLGYALASASSALITGAAVAVALLPFADIAFADPLALIYFATMTALFFALLGMAIGLWARRWDHYSLATELLFVPPSYLSGMFFPVAILPAFGAELVALNPFFYALDGFRRALTGWGESDPWVGAALLLVGNLLLLGALYRLIAKGWRVKA